MSELRYFFATKNIEKLKDVQDLVGDWHDIRIEHFDIGLKEFQTDDVVELVEHKLVEAYRKIKRPTIVDHTCLQFDALKGLPGTQTSIFWNTLGAEHICTILKSLNNWKAEVKVCLGYTDGLTLKTIVKSRKGTITAAPRGSRNFDWDAIFIPKGSKLTYAEMTPHEKNKASPRALAFNEFRSKVSIPA
jgi:XTP/dITP diphosphohydrolase